MLANFYLRVLHFVRVKFSGDYWILIISRELLLLRFMLLFLSSLVEMLIDRRLRLR